MTTAREIMTPGVECVSVGETLVDAARRMRDLDVGALPICGEDDRLAGMLTDRDIVMRSWRRAATRAQSRWATSPTARW